MVLQVVPQRSASKSTPSYYIGKTSVYLTGWGEQPTDSLTFADMTIHYHGKKPGIQGIGLACKRFLYKKTTVFPNTSDLYSEALARLGIFKYTEFVTLPKTPVPTVTPLNVKVKCHGLTFPTTESWNSMSQTKEHRQTGPGAIFSLSRRTLCVQPLLSFQLKGSLWMANRIQQCGDKSKMNSYELGASFSLIILVCYYRGWRTNQTACFSSYIFSALYRMNWNRTRFFKMLSFRWNRQLWFQPSRTWKTHRLHSTLCNIPPANLTPLSM